MTERVIAVILLAVLLCLVFIFPKVMNKTGVAVEPTQVVQTTTESPYAGLEKLTDFPTEANFPKDYILVYDRNDGSNIVIIEKGMNYLVKDSSKDSYGGLLVTNSDGKFYYRNLLTDGRWGNLSVVTNRGSDYMENDLTKDRWEYPKKFIKDIQNDFKDSGKSVYIGKKEKIAGVECNHYIIKSAWYEYNYWVHPKTNITLKYSKVEVRFGERKVSFEITASKFSNKPSFNGYVPDDINPD